MADVFISYSKADAVVVRGLAEAVRRLGYEVWWDEELPAHLSYSDVIAEKIEAAKAAIVVWSESAAASQWVRAEADLARNRGKLIQASFDGRMPPMPFNQIQFAALGDWRGEDDHHGWQKVKASLAALAGPRTAVAAPPPAVAPSAPAPAGSRLVPVLIGLLLLVSLPVTYLLWPRGGGEPAAPAPPAPRAAAAKAEVPVAARRPRADLRRSCAGPGRGSPRCRRPGLRRAQR